MCFEETLQPKAYRSLHARRQLMRDRARLRPPDAGWMGVRRRCAGIFAALRGCAGQHFNDVFYAVLITPLERPSCRYGTIRECPEPQTEPPGIGPGCLGQFCLSACCVGSGCFGPAAARPLPRIRQMPVRLNIRQKLFAGMGTASSIHKSAARPSFTTSSIFRTPQAGFVARSWSSKASLLGAVWAPSRL